MKKIITLFLSVMVLAGCTTSPVQNSTDSNILDGSDTDSSDESIFVTATFIVGEGVTPIATQTVIVGEKFKKPNDPIKDEYTFGGWFTDDSYSSLFNFDVSYTTDQIIYAKWDEITYEYYIYGVLNSTDVFLPDKYMQEQYRLGAPREEDSNAIAAIYGFHLMPYDEVHIIRFGSDGTEKIYNYSHSEGYARGYFDVLLYENDISLRLIRYDDWIINFLNGGDAGDVYASLTKTSSDDDFAYYEVKNLEVAAGQRLFLSFAWEYDPEDYYGIMCEIEYPVNKNTEEWIQPITPPSDHWPGGETYLYEFQKDEKYDVVVRVNKDAAFDGNIKVTFSFSENELIINEDGSYNLGLIKDIFSDWVSGNNQFENDVFNYKSSGGWGTLQEVFFVDPENLELYATTFNQEYNLKLFAKLSIGDAAFLEDMSAKNVVTEYDFLRRLNEISVRKIGTTSFIEIDQTVSSENANARAVNLLKKVGNDADVIFAYETAPGALDLEFGMGYTYDSIAYTSDSMLHVFHVSCLSKEHVLNDTDKYGVVSDTVTSIYEQNLEFYQDA